MSSPVDKVSAIVAGGGLFAISGLVFNMLPIILGAAADSLSLSQREIGFLASAYLAGFAGISILSMFWGRQVNWRKLMILACITFILSLAFSTQLVSFVMLACALIIAGASTGTIYCIAILSLGDATQNERALNAGVMMGLLLAAMGVWIFPVWVIPQYGFAGVLWGIVGISALASLVIPWFPEGNTKKISETMPQGTLAGKALVFVGLFAHLFYYMGVIALWSYLERVGKAADVEPTWIGIAFSVEKVMVLIVCIIIFWQGKRFGHRNPLLIGFGGVLIAIFLSMIVSGKYSYVFCVALFGMGWTYAVPYQMAIVVQSDHAGRYTGLLPAFMGFGSALGPGLAGLLTTGTSLTPVSIMTIVLCFIGLLLFLVAARNLSDKHMPEMNAPLSQTNIQ